MAHYYCSTYSRDYIYKGLVLYDSLHKFDPDFHFFFICLHDEVRNLLEGMQLSHATLINIKDIENEDQELADIKNTRSDKEYVWTSKASALLYLFNHFSQIDHIIWLDGDTAFLSDTRPIFDEWGDYSIFLTEEKYAGKYEWLSRIYGVYNTGFMGFKRDGNALLCIRWFREKLIEWCFDRLEEGRWSDQMYVNDWTTRFNNVGIVENIGVNVTPYVIFYARTELGCPITWYDNDIYIGDRKLVLFHYYGFKYYNGNEFDLCTYSTVFTDQIIKWIYMPYIYACNEAKNLITYIDKDFCYKHNPIGRFITNYFNLHSNNNGYGGKYSFCTIIGMEDLHKGLAFYYSLKKHAKRFCLWICCMDDPAYSTLTNMKLDNVILIDIKNIEDEELLKVKDTRKAFEYRWALKAPLMLYILKNNYNIRYMIYTDAELPFSPEDRIALRRWKKAPVFIHRKGTDEYTQKESGSDKACLIGFKRSKSAFRYLWQWREKCIRVCCDEA